MSKAKFPGYARTALLALTPVLLGACTSLVFVAANFPSVFGDYTVDRDLKYGSLARQSLDIYVPDEAAPPPIVVFVHGGSWIGGTKEQYRFVAEALTSRGMIAVLPNYRLHPDVQFPAFVDDVAAAVAWTHAHAADFGGDSNRIYLMGHSAGAQITAMLALNTPYLANAGARREWVKGFIGLAGPYDFLPFRDEYLKVLFGPESRYPETQPVNFADAHAPRTLLIHGEADTVVLPSNSRSLAARLRSQGVDVTERYYPEMSHTDVMAALSLYFRGRRDILREIDNFVHEESRSTAAMAP